MNCNEIVELINLEIDGVLPESEQETLARHLRLCHDCAERGRQLRETARLLSTLPKASLPASFAQAVMARLPSISRKPALFDLRGSVAAALMGILGLLLLFLAGYGAGSNHYVFPQTEVELDTELAQVTSPLEGVTSETEAAFDSLLDAIESVPLEFVIGMCLILGSTALLFLHLMNQATESPTAALVRIRRPRHHA
ncbi:MAG: zf-HC2 domain-containing protein [Chloroflexi bacterium]|nr:zf-HC2 domain-containing protein [Chloroflexota bacterium]